MTDIAEEHLTLVDFAEFDAATAGSTGSNGQGELLTRLAKTPLARHILNERRKGLRRDAVHLTRIEKSDGSLSDYVRWTGRCSDGYFRDFGPPMKIIREGGSHD